MNDCLMQEMLPIDHVIAQQVVDIHLFHVFHDVYIRLQEYPLVSLLLLQVHIRVAPSAALYLSHNINLSAEVHVPVVLNHSLLVVILREDVLPGEKLVRDRLWTAVKEVEKLYSLVLNEAKVESIWVRVVDCHSAINVLKEIAELALYSVEVEICHIQLIVLSMKDDTMRHLVHSIDTHDLLIVMKRPEFYLQVQLPYFFDNPSNGECRCQILIDVINKPVAKVDHILDAGKFLFTSHLKHAIPDFKINEK